MNEPAVSAAPEADVVQKWRSVLANYSFPTLIAMFAAGTLVIGVPRVPDGSLGGPILVVSLFSLLAALSLWQFWQYAHFETVLTAEQLSVDYGSVSMTVALTSVSGVLVARCPQWHIFVMRVDGPPVVLPVPNVVFMWRSQALAQPDIVYWQHVADSPAGLAARLIHEVAQRAQSDDGPLATAPPLAETLVGIGGSLSRASRWWSPTGECSSVAP